MSKIRNSLSVFIVALTAVQACYVWLERLQMPLLREIVYSQWVRPGVYRVLVPYLSRLLEKITHIDAVYCMFALTVLFAVGYYYSLRYLVESFGENPKADLIAFIGCELTFIVMLFEMNVYDIPTAFFFTLGFALLARGKYGWYYILFPIATINRETTFLLLLFYGLYFFFGPISRRHWFYGSIYQGLSLLIIRMLIMAHFAGHRGYVFWWMISYVIEKYSSLKGLGMLAAALIVLYFVTRRWSEKPLFLRVAFVTLFPIQLVLHFLVGIPFEIRVFVEVFPIMVVMAGYPLPARPRSRETSPSPA